MRVRKLKSKRQRPGTTGRASKPRRRDEPTEGGHVVESLEERLDHAEAGPVLSGGDVDADWQRAASTGEEAVGGSVATPDQDVVDEIGRALGVEQAVDAELHTSEEVLRARDRRRWQLERRLAEEDEER